MPRGQMKGMIGLLFLFALLLQSECVRAQELPPDLPSVDFSEAEFFPPAPVMIGLGATFIGSLCCAGAGTMCLVNDNPSKGWGLAGVISAAGLIVFSISFVAFYDDASVAIVPGALAVVTGAISIKNIHGANERKASHEKGPSLTADLRPDGARSLQPCIGLVWRF